MVTSQPRVSAYPDDEATLSCTVEAHPPPITYWTRADGRQQLLTNTSKYELQLLRHPTLPYKSEMRLRILRLQQQNDFTGYSCVAGNNLGQSSGSIVLNALRRPPTTSTSTTPSPFTPPPRRRRPPSSPSTTTTNSPDQSYPIENSQLIPAGGNERETDSYYNNQANLHNTQSSNWWLRTQSTVSPESDDSDEPWQANETNGDQSSLSSSLIGWMMMITFILIWKSMFDQQFRIR